MVDQYHIVKNLKQRFKHISTWRVIQCSKCRGRGILNWTMVDAGICYSCKGTGVFVDKWSNYRRRMKEDEKRREKGKEAAKRSVERFEQNKERYEILHQFITNFERNKFCTQYNTPDLRAGKNE